MAGRKVIWTSTARKQRRSVLQYWKQRNQSSEFSKKLIAQISDRTHLIAKRPFIFRVSEFPDMRVSPMGHFSIFYRVSDSAIVIFAFWDNRDDPGFSEIFRIFVLKAAAKNRLVKFQKIQSQ